MLHFLELPHFRLQAQRGISRLHFKPHLLTLGCPLVKSIVMNSRRRHVYAINFQLPLYLLKIELGGKEPFKAKKLASVTSRTPGGSGHHQGLTLWSKGTVLEKILALGRLLLPQGHWKVCGWRTDTVRDHQGLKMRSKGT